MFLFQTLKAVVGNLCVGLAKCLSRTLRNFTSAAFYNLMTPSNPSFDLF